MTAEDVNLVLAALAGAVCLLLLIAWILYAAWLAGDDDAFHQ